MRTDVRSLTYDIAHKGELPCNCANIYVPDNRPCYCVKNNVMKSNEPQQLAELQTAFKRMITISYENCWGTMNIYDWWILLLWINTHNDDVIQEYGK